MRSAPSHCQNGLASRIASFLTNGQALFNREVVLDDPVLDRITLLIAEQLNELDQVLLILNRKVSIGATILHKHFDFPFVLGDEILEVLKLLLGVLVEHRHDQFLLEVALREMVLYQHDGLVSVQLGQLQHAVLHDLLKVGEGRVRVPVLCMDLLSATLPSSILSIIVVS